MQQVQSMHARAHMSLQHDVIKLAVQALVEDRVSWQPWHAVAADAAMAHWRARARTQ